MIVIVIMQLAEASRQAKVGELDVSAPIQQDVIWFYIPGAYGQSPILLGVAEGKANLCMNSSLWTASMAMMISAI